MTRKNMISHPLLKRIIIGLLLVTIVLYAVSGFGITEYRTVEALTFGLLTKKLAFRIHDYLFIPFLVLLTAHIVFQYILGRRHSKKPPHTFFTSLN